jgi:hypothetical protein
MLFIYNRCETFVAKHIDNTLIIDMSHDKYATMQFTQIRNTVSALKCLILTEALRNRLDQFWCPFC